MSQRPIASCGRSSHSLFAILITLLCNQTLAADDPQWTYELDLLEVRSIDGSGNSIGGASKTPLLRKHWADYAGDGSGDEMISDPDRENPRTISNRIADQRGRSIRNRKKRSDYLWAWGQFLDHDLDLTEAHSDNGIADIPIEDPLDPLGPNPIFFSRSNYDHKSGYVRRPRNQMNELSAFIDASNVYGSDATRAAALRTFAGGRMKTSAGQLLPFNTEGLPNGGGTGSSLFLAGDVRANENVMLCSLHTLFVREHNRLAALIQLLAPQADDEAIYQAARKIVGAEMQIITYREFLPALLGPNAPQLELLSYDSTIDPSITNEFSTAFYRFGHTLLSPNLVLTGIGREQVSLPLRHAFFQPQVLTGDPLNVDRLLIGATTQVCQNVDNTIVDDVRNFLFGPPGAGGLDLAALNIQRGRDHGLPDYNTLRAAYGLSPYSSVNEISSVSAVRRALLDLYGGPDNIDAWVGGLAENHVNGACVGELLTTALSEQFQRLIRGDRLSVVNDLDLDSQIVQAAIDLDSLTLARVIRANTLATSMSEDVFTVGRKLNGDVLATYDQAGNRVHLIGNSAANTVAITELPFGVVIAGSKGTKINGQRMITLTTDALPNLTVDLGGGNDSLDVAMCRFGDCIIQLGDGDDLAAAYVSQAQRFAIDCGAGLDRYNDGITAPDDQSRTHNLP